MNSRNPEAPALQTTIALALVSGVMRLGSWLPLSWNREIGATMGRLAWLANGSLRRITLTNLTLCYPNLSDCERNKLARSSLMHTGRALTESAWVWLQDPKLLLARTRIIAGESLFQNALASDQGVILATPHLGNWEACNIVAAQNQPITYLYRAPRATWLEPLFIRWRGNFDTHPARLDAGGLRQVLQQLKRGKLVGVLPDQEPELEGGVFAPLFNVSANSMTLLQKLGSRGNARVLFCVCQRDSGRWFKHKPGWTVSFLEPDPLILDSDPLVATTALNKTIQRCIDMNPEQYLWSYKRFNLLEQGGRRDYKARE